MWQPVFMISGYFIALLGFAMLIPAGFDIYFLKESWSPFLSSSIIALFIGLSLFLANKTKITKFSLHQGFLLTTMAWGSVALLSTLPFIFSDAMPKFADAFFEAFSGITATGATIVADVESLPKSILLWRSMLNGLGGIGIVIFGIAMMPFLGIGGMQIFQRENSDFGDQFMPKMGAMAKRLLFVYLILLVTCTLALYGVGMNMFDALNHALATISTGGFSTKNTSIGFYNSASVEAVIVLFMILGSLPISYYLMVFYKNKGKSLKTAQVIGFLKIATFYIIGVSVWLVYNGIYDWVEALRQSSFNIVSIMTTTGFASVDYMKWGNFTYLAFLVFALTGGCTGSTTGSVKIFRWQALLAYLKNAFLKATNPNVVSLPTIQGHPLDSPIMNSVLTFLGLYLSTLFVVMVLLSLDGLPFEVSISGAIACFTNTGPGVGDLVGPAGNYSTLSDFAKCVLSIGMLLGRLEVLTVLVIFSPSFWKN